ncbi:hypothetical protein HUT19_26515 [Streptomyces sp. NA02950]|uniref:hypothetical protein n=1 Tax=Streptomyces sp. NA02950 TaxID=2742137 RepID=UPI00159234CB|nr:hypothetical protein [Streptomyces sp. NA02950]QKV94861.1 hypothetical protein HUT19_26515 [Streptomyces sp. NA02950]
MGSLRRAVSASLLAASLITLSAACGREHPAAGAHPSRSTGGTSPSRPGGRIDSGRIDTGLAYFASTSGGAPEIHTVLRDGAGLDAFAGHFGRRADAITAKARNTDFSRTALVGWSMTTGCARWPSATLRRSGDRLVLVAGRHPSPPPECFAPFHLIAVFVVPKERLPSQPVFS